MPIFLPKKIKNKPISELPHTKLQSTASKTSTQLSVTMILRTKTKKCKLAVGWKVIHLLKYLHVAMYVYAVVCSNLAGTSKICVSCWDRNTFPCFVDCFENLSGIFPFDLLLMLLIKCYILIKS